MAELLARYALFSGCASEDAGAPARLAAVTLARMLGIEFWEPSTGGCCGARADRPCSEAALRRLLAPLAETARQGLATVCLSPGCRRVISPHVPAPDHADGPNAATAGSPLDYLQLFAQEAVAARLASCLVMPLSPLRVALHGTCHGDHYPAPKPAASGATPATPGQGLADLLAMTGATVGEEVSAAGYCAETPLLPATIPFTGAPPCLSRAVQDGANLVVTPCFLCFGTLNERQRRLDRQDPVRSVPVLHLAHLLGVACGAAPARLGLGAVAVSTRHLLAPYLR